MSEELKWEIINTEAKSQVRRLQIDGGWLYQVQTGWEWHDFNKGVQRPVFGETTYVPLMLGKQHASVP